MIDLPPIKLPEITLPFEVPALLHPPVDHFAIALPAVVLLLEVYNLFARRKIVAFASWMLLLIAAVAIAGAYVTGMVDGKAVYDSLDADARQILLQHRVLGSYLLLLTGVIVAIRFLAMVFRSPTLRIITIALLVLLGAGLLEQGEEGGKLVYIHGAHVAKVQALDEQLFDTKEALEEAQSRAAKVNTPAQSTSVEAAPTSATEADPEPAKATPPSQNLDPEAIKDDLHETSNRMIQEAKAAVATP